MVAIEADPEGHRILAAVIYTTTEEVEVVATSLRAIIRDSPAVEVACKLYI